MSSEITANQQEDDCKDCRTRKFCWTDLVECLEKSDCNWAINFGCIRFCKHSSALQCTHSRLPSLHN
jgi:hypothetical protein